jgi:hemerythrin-like domain-containing protein
MSTTQRPQRRQLTLPGQVHTAEGPLDMSGMYVIHHALRRDLDRFVRAVERTPLEDAAVWQALAGRWRQFASMLHHHHTIEDASIWPPLLERVDGTGVAGARETLEAMQAEHGRIDPTLAGCTEAFDTMASGPDAATRDRLVGLVDEARDLIGRHLAHEETDALPLVQQHLPAEAWQASEEHARRSFSLRQLPFLVPWAASGLTPSALAPTLAQLGPQFRVALRLFRRRFERAESLAFRHA